MAHRPFASAPYVVGEEGPAPVEQHIPAEESLCPVVSHEWVNAEYKHLVVDASPKALAVKPGQFFNLLCPSPDAGELWLRRPQSVYRIDRENRRVEFLYKCVGRGTYGLATLEVGEELNMVGPLGVGFTIPPGCKHIVVLGRGVGLATLAPISQLAADSGIGVSAILSARSAEFVMADDLFAEVGEVIAVLDSDGSSAVEHVETILKRLIAQRRADAFYTCGSNRLFQLMKRLGNAHGIPGQVAMEQVMACDVSPSEIDVLEVNISCPTRDPKGGNFALHEEHTFNVMRRIRTTTDKPIWCKLSPNAGDVVGIAKAAEAAGADALVVSNTILGLKIDVNTFRPSIGNKFGGLSGPGIKPIIVRMVYQCAKAVKIPIIGCGGIVKVEDVVEYMLAGASAVMIGYLIFRNPSGIIAVIEGLEEWCARRGFARVADLTGAMIDEAPRETYAAAAAPIG